MIKTIKERDIFTEDIISLLNKRVVILVATEEFICRKFNINKSEKDYSGLISQRTEGLFNEIKEKIDKGEFPTGYKVISPRLDAVIMADTEEGEETLSNYISTEMDIVSS